MSDDNECPDCGETERRAAGTECANCGHVFPEVTHYWKIHVTFDDAEAIGGESMHGERIGDGPTPGTGLYRIDNIPFFANLRIDDVLVCDESNPDEIPEFVSVHEQSDQPTARVLFADGLTDEEMSTVAETLRQLGSKTERGMQTFWAVALPSDEDKRELAIQVLAAGEDSGVIKMFEVVDDDED